MFGNPVQGPRIVPMGQLRKATDVLPNGHPAFRVTQRFGDQDIYFPGVHGALDMGNGQCGEAVIAAGAGWLTNERDAWGALIVRIVHSGALAGYTTRYVHLARYALASGRSVTRGQIIGYHGATGLDVGGCHLHFEVWTGGKRVDPWPLLDQNRVVVAPTGFPRRGYVAKGVNVRYLPTSTRVGNVHHVTTVAGSYTFIGSADGPPPPGGSTSRRYLVYTDKASGKRLCIHSSVVRWV